MTASGPGGVIQKKSRKISNGQRGLPRRPGSSPAVEDGACQGARSDERSSLALDWRWPLPQRTVRIVSMNSVSGSVPSVPTRSVGPVHDINNYLEAISLAEAADSKRSASIGLGVGGALLLGVSVPIIAFLGGLKQ